MRDGTRKRWAYSVAIMSGVFACGTEPCQRQVLELVYDDPFYEFLSDQLDSFRALGWTCNSTGSIRNAFGVAIGIAYECTKC